MYKHKVTFHMNACSIKYLAGNLQKFLSKLHQDLTNYCSSDDQCTGRADTCTSGDCRCGTSDECSFTEACSAGKCTGKRL